MDNPEPVAEESAAHGKPVGVITDVPGKTGMLRSLVSALDRFECLMTVPGTVRLETKTINTAKATIREPNPLALVTTIRNDGDNLARIYEAGIIVSVVQPGAQKDLKERGKFKLEGDTPSGSTYLFVLTHERSACGDVAQFLAPDTEPIGSFLL